MKSQLAKYLTIAVATALLTACQPGLVARDGESLAQIKTEIAAINSQLAEQNQAKEQATKQQKQTSNQLKQQEKLLKSINNQLSELNKQADNQENPNLDSEKNKHLYKILNDKLIVGSVEKIHFTPSNWVLDARIDTGATTSSIDAREITEFERDGKNWVKFTLVNRELKQNLPLEMPIKRIVNISQASVKEPIKRLVVEFLVKIGNLEILTDFTLNDRDHMEFPVLVGRTLLRDIILVDVSQQYLAPLVLENDRAEAANNQEIATKTEGQK